MIKLNTSNSQEDNNFVPIRPSLNEIFDIDRKKSERQKPQNYEKPQKQ